MLQSYFNKVGRPEGMQLYQKDTSTQVFSYEICEISKNTYFEEYLRTTASAFLPKNRKKHLKESFIRLYKWLIFMGQML